MDLLIKHGTWVIVLVIPVLALLYLHVSSRLYPFVVARLLKEEDARGARRQVAPAKHVVPARPASRRMTVS